MTGSSGLAALPLFMSLRAAIRAKVEAANVAHLAGAAATPPTPTLGSPRASRPKSSPSPAGAGSTRVARSRRPSQRRGEN
jgi:hypothetical protein